jgi:hypothetical protein
MDIITNLPLLPFNALPLEGFFIAARGKGRVLFSASSKLPDLCTQAPRPTYAPKGIRQAFARNLPQNLDKCTLKHTFLALKRHSALFSRKTSSFP